MKEIEFPAHLKPMLATLIDRPFDEPGWLYEVKWDGYRALAFMNKGIVDLKSRNQKSFNEKFYPVYDAIKAWGISAIVDGEIVVLDNKGISNFGALQGWRSEADGTLAFYVFDILWLDGKDLTSLPLTERREILRSVMPKDDTLIRLSETNASSGADFFNGAMRMGMEGIIAKKSDSLYHPDERSTDWLKIKVKQQQEVVIGGFTNNEGSNKLFSALLVGVFDAGTLRFTGKIGTGFNARNQKELMEQFEPLIIPANPFNTLPDINSPSRFRPNPPKATVTWLKPNLVCQVAFAEMTADGVMRHPSFKGLRIDKKASEVHYESPIATSELTTDHKSLAAKNIIAPGIKRARKTFLNPKDESQVRVLDGHELKFKSLSKLYWPEEGISKRDMLNYYYQVAPYILPYLKGRPQSLNRHPNGIHGIQFYQKDVKGKVPGWINTFRYYSEADQREKEFFICDDEPSLLYLASLGCIEINPWNSKADAPDNPDWCVIDLDPDKNSFDQVIDAAQVTHELLESIDVPSYCKTSGSTGLHIYIPLAAKYNYEESKEFARALVTVIHQKLPDFTSIERQVADRGGKMYLDFLQNRPQATVAAPYSLRPKAGATVSMPLHWHEVKKGLRMSDFTINNALERIQREGDLFKPVIGKGINIEKALKKLRALQGKLS